MSQFIGAKSDLIAKILLALCLGTILFSGLLLLDTYLGDPTIYLVYARNIAEGDIFSYNPGEFSSGSTSPLWAAILSIPYQFANSILLTKVTAIIVALFALFVTYFVSFKISGSQIGSALASGTMLYFLILPGLLMYESSLIVILVATLIWLTYRAVRNPKYRFKYRDLLLFTLIWMFIPMTRPEATIIVLLSVGTLLINFREDFRLVRIIVGGFILSLVPMTAYFGYSSSVLGSFSVSSANRVFSLRERTNSAIGFHYSLQPAMLFFRYPLLIITPVFVWAMERFGYHDRTYRYLAVFSASTLTAYILLFSIVSPVSSRVDIERYLLPCIPFIVVWLSLGLGELWRISIDSRFVATAFIIIGYFLLFPILSVVIKAQNLQDNGYTFDLITEKNVIEYLNSVASPGDIVLSYEVQNRYHLSPNLQILSLDGIVDGKVGPYLTTADMTSFLKEYKPRYWIQNDAVFYRPYLSKSILRQVVEETKGEQGHSVQVDGITFTNIYNRIEPEVEGFAGYRHLYELSYE